MYVGNIGIVSLSHIYTHSLSLTHSLSPSLSLSLYLSLSLSLSLSPSLSLPPSPFLLTLSLWVSPSSVCARVMYVCVCVCSIQQHLHNISLLLEQYQTFTVT